MNPYQLYKSDKHQIPLSATKRLRGALAQRIHEDRKLAWKMLPFILSLIVGALVSGLQIESQLGEGGDANAYQGQDASFSSPSMLVEAPPPPSKASPEKNILEDIAPELMEQAVDPPVELTAVPIKIEIADSPAWDEVELDIPDQRSPIVNLDYLAQPEAQEVEPEPEPEPKAKPKNAITSNSSRPSPASKSSIGASSSKAAGKVSVSYKYAPQPPYPTRMRASRTQGTVIVRIQVNAQGRPESVSIKKSSGHSEFDDTARSWILNKWSFSPAKEGDQAVASVVTTSIHFVYS